MTAVGGLVLAAGAGTRLGGPKALLEVDGELFVERACRVLAEAGCAPVVAVLGAGTDEVLARTELPEVELNPEWETGMGSSLRAGLGALTGRCEAAVVALVDQPRVGVEAIRRLLAAWRDGARIAVATYGGDPRNPVLLDASVWGEAFRVSVGDRGARDLLRSRSDLVVHVDCDGTGDPADVDTPTDLAALGQEHPWS